jgi:aquaporin NIP
MNFSIRHALAAEFLGTFALVLAGTGAIVVNQQTGGTITHVGIALTFGLVVAAMILTFGSISGAHLNPAVTLGMVAARRMPASIAVWYLAAQVAGAFAASGVVMLLFPTNETLGTTLPAITPWRAFALEAILTAMLMTTILSVTAAKSDPSIAPVHAALAVGSVIGLEALFAGPATGASMNPARSLAPAVLSGTTQHLWLYLAGPTLGAILAAGILGPMFGTSRPR